MERAIEPGDCRTEMLQVLVGSQVQRCLCAVKGRISSKCCL